MIERTYVVEGAGHQVFTRQVRDNWFIGFSGAFPGLIFARRYMPDLMDTIVAHLHEIRDHVPAGDPLLTSGLPRPVQTP